jgi:hypothetical protein
MVGQSSRLCKWTGVHLHVSRASNLFLQCQMHYISYIGFGMLGWKFTVDKDGDGTSLAGVRTCE